uniref:Putative secreted protein n=1 Tax=Ixodes ricinus TaxID=34613 RepID=A0A6B0U8K4_IXORI
MRSISSGSLLSCWCCSAEAWMEAFSWTSCLMSSRRARAVFRDSWLSSSRATWPSEPRDSGARASSSGSARFRSSRCKGGGSLDGQGPDRFMGSSLGGGLRRFSS